MEKDKQMDNTEIELNKEPVDISAVKINMDLPIEERIKDYIQSIETLSTK